MFQAPADAEREALRRMLGVSGPMLLTVKRLHPVAGDEDLLKAFAILATECGRLLVHRRQRRAPTGFSSAKPRQLASRLASAFSGSSRTRTFPIYAAADLFVLASGWSPRER